MAEDDRLLKEVIEAWRTTQRANLHLIEHISEEVMHCTLSTRGGRNVVRQFTHLHVVRGWQLKKRAAPLAAGLREFETKEEPDRETLVAALEDSSARVEEGFGRAHAAEPKFRTFRRGPVTTVGYLIAHASHHRGNVLLTLEPCGHSPGKETQYPIWGWNRT